MTPRTCTVALAYPRFELPFVAEWVDYHLALGIDHIYLGMHVNEDLIATDNYLTPKRPFREMYELEASEADVVDRFLGEVRPFRDRVSLSLLHRTFSTDPTTWRSMQRRVYNAMLGTHRSSYDWFCPHDIDEYLVPQAPYESLKDALGTCASTDSVVIMEQVIAGPRWDETHHPRARPLIVPNLARCRQIVPRYNGAKCFVRSEAATALGIHRPELIADAEVIDDRRILMYHLRGFPSDTEVTGIRLPIEDPVFDEIDDRPWRLLQHATGRHAGVSEAPPSWSGPDH